MESMCDKAVGPRRSDTSEGGGPPGPAPTVTISVALRASGEIKLELDGDYGDV